jgi:hypothetical protein
MEHLHEQSFTWQAWSGGNLSEMLDIETREEIIIVNAPKIRKYAIGWCYGESLPCRPKKNTIAVMFFTDGVEWWTHLTKTEFSECFPEIKI